MEASRIERVTVYREGARVERVLALAEAKNEARFAGLPLTMDDGSLRAHVSGSGVALDVHVSVEVPEENASLAPAIDEAQESARVGVERARLEVTRIQAAIARLEGLKVLPRPQPRENEPPLPIPLEARQRLVAARVAEEERLAAALAGANASAREADKKLAEANAAAKARTSARNAKEHELRKVVTVALSGAEKGAAVTLEYAVPHARWSASYVLTLPGAGDAKAKLGMRALVAQRTGEDWSGVKLRLSTAAPDAWAELPELTKSRIGRAQPPPRKGGYREPPEGAQALYADYDAVAGPPSAEPVVRDEPAALAEEEAELGEVQRAYAIPMARSVPSPAPTTVPAAPVPPPMMAPPMQAPAGAPARPRPAARSRGAFTGAPQALSLGGVAKAAPEEAAADEPLAPQRVDWMLAVDALAYGRLRMRAPGSATRGELVAVSQVSVYMEGLGALEIDVAARVRVAFERARIDARALPPGYELARSGDAYDYAYAAELPCDVTSDGVYHAVPVADWEAETVLRHVAVPREAQQIFRLLEIKSPIDAALLSGPLDVYDGGAYRTTTRMPPTPPRGRVEIGLGVEPAVKIARTTTFQEESAGLLGGSLALSHRVAVELRNLLPRPVTVEVRERIPVIRKDDTEVKVEVGAVEPPWEKWDQEQSLRGGYAWKVPLEPGTTRKLSAHYTIRIASKLELAGGNRRES